MSDEREIFGHLMDVDLSEDDLASKKNRLVAVDCEIIELNRSRAESASRFNEDLKTKRKEQTTLLESINAGKAKVEVSCYLERDERLGKVITRRQSDGEQVDERAMTAEERGETTDDRQGNLFEGGARPDLDAASDDEESPSDADADATLAEYIAQNGAGDPDDEDEPIAAAGDDDAAEEATH